MYRKSPLAVMEAAEMEVAEMAAVLAVEAEATAEVPAAAAAGPAAAVLSQVSPPRARAWKILAYQA